MPQKKTPTKRTNASAWLEAIRGPRATEVRLYGPDLELRPRQPPPPARRRRPKPKLAKGGA